MLCCHEDMSMRAKYSSIGCCDDAMEQLIHYLQVRGTAADASDTTMTRTISHLGIDHLLLQPIRSQHCHFKPCHLSAVVSILSIVYIGNVHCSFYRGGGGGH